MLGMNSSLSEIQNFSKIQVWTLPLIIDKYRFNFFRPVISSCLFIHTGPKTHLYSLKTYRKLCTGQKVKHTGIMQ